MEEVTVVVVDDHPLFASGTVGILAGQPGVRPLGYALGADEAVRLIGRTRPDVVVSDVMLDTSPAGLELPARLAAVGLGSIPVLFLSEYRSQEFQVQAISAGAAGYLHKTASAEELSAAVRAVAGGMTAFPRTAIVAQSNGPRRPSPREAEILSLVAEGASNEEAATRLGISDKTVETHLSRLFKRYGVASRTQLAVMADRRGWLIRHRETSKRETA